ncbi:MAG: hypothetical protein MMC33_001753 [Icmadophila ericetorum]|nr:hypothetical protein [Icmadophila ericetorum]
MSLVTPPSLDSTVVFFGVLKDVAIIVFVGFYIKWGLGDFDEEVLCPCTNELAKERSLENTHSPKKESSTNEMEYRNPKVEDINDIPPTPSPEDSMPSRLPRPAGYSGTGLFGDFLNEGSPIYHNQEVPLRTPPVLPIPGFFGARNVEHEQYLPSSRRSVRNHAQTRFGQGGWF